MLIKSSLLTLIESSDLPDHFLTDLLFRIKEFQHPSRSQCPDCNSALLRKFSSLNLKVCDDCGREIDWRLKDMEKAIV